MFVNWFYLLLPYLETNRVVLESKIKFHETITHATRQALKNRLPKRKNEWKNLLSFKKVCRVSVRIVSNCGRQKQNDPPLLNVIMYAQHAPNNICSYNEFLFITLKTCKDTLHFNWRIIKLKMNHSPCLCVLFAAAANKLRKLGQQYSHPLPQKVLTLGRAGGSKERKPQSNPVSDSVDGSEWPI